jgi:hypothetical protein
MTTDFLISDHLNDVRNVLDRNRKNVAGVVLFSQRCAERSPTNDAPDKHTETVAASRRSPMKTHSYASRTAEAAVAHAVNTAWEIEDQRDDIREIFGVQI